MFLKILFKSNSSTGPTQCQFHILLLFNNLGYRIVHEMYDFDTGNVRLWIFLTRPEKTIQVRE